MFEDLEDTNIGVDGNRNIYYKTPSLEILLRNLQESETLSKEWEMAIITFIIQ